MATLDEEVTVAGDVHPAAVAGRLAGDIVLDGRVQDRKLGAGTGYVLDPATGPVGRVLEDEGILDAQRTPHGIENAAAAAGHPGSPVFVDLRTGTHQ